MGRPEEIATVALFHSPPVDSSFVNGIELYVDGGTATRSSIPCSRPTRTLFVIPAGNLLLRFPIQSSSCPIHRDSEMWELVRVWVGPKTLGPHPAPQIPAILIAFPDEHARRSLYHSTPHSRQHSPASA